MGWLTTREEPVVTGDRFIFLLADNMKESADIVLGGHRELVLNTDWLSYLNARFPECDRGESFTPATYNFSRTEHTPLAFLFEFFQMVPKLKLVQGPRYDITVGDMFDLSSFRSLTSLRLVRVDVQRVYGIQRMRAQLRRIHCRRSLHSLSFLLGKCAADQAESENPWPALEFMDCSSNSIQSMDGALHLIPSVKHLDLSDNNIDEIPADIRKMIGLTQLNLGYNSIVSIKALSHADTHGLARLSILVLCNNKIESLLGLECLSGLVKLDLSRNDIQSFDEFRRIRHLESLRYLWLEGNPISCEKHFRARVMAMVKDWPTYMLDGELCTNIEEQLLVEHYMILGGAAPANSRANGESNQKVAEQSFVEPPIWQKGRFCSICSDEFTWRFGGFPRHHCRNCGRSVCQEHSTRSRILAQFGFHYEGPQRVCDTCFAALNQNPTGYNLEDVDSHDEVVVSHSTKGRKHKGKTKTRRRPKSVEISNSDANPDSSVVSKSSRSTKSKRDKVLVRTPSALLAEQEDLRAQVEQIFETGGPEALAIYQAWLDQNPSHDTTAVFVDDEENTNDDGDDDDDGGDEPTLIAHTQPFDPLDVSTNSVTQNINTTQDSAVATTTPLTPTTSTATTTFIPRAASTPMRARRLVDMASSQDDDQPSLHRQDNHNQTQTHPVKMDEDLCITLDYTDDSILHDDKTLPTDQSNREDSPTLPPVEVKAESTAEFIVDVYDRTQRSIRRILQIQGASFVMVIDFITGKTVDMVDLSCLMVINQTTEDEYGPSPPKVKLNFVYGRSERRTIEFLMESEDERDELVELLDPIVKANRSSKANESVSARFKCLKCDHMFAYEEERFEDSSDTACPNCKSLQVVEFFFQASEKLAEDIEATTPTPKKTQETAGHKESKSQVSNVAQAANISPVPNQGYDMIIRELPIDCTVVDHTLKLLLDLEYFDDSIHEKCLGALHAQIWLPPNNIQDGFLFCSNKFMYLFDVAEGKPNVLLTKFGYERLRHIDISVFSQRIRVVLDDNTFCDVLSGDAARTWSLLRLLGSNTLLEENQSLSECPLHWDQSFVRAVHVTIEDFGRSNSRDTQRSYLGNIQGLRLEATEMEKECEQLLKRTSVCLAVVVRAQGEAGVVLLMTSEKLYFLQLAYGVAVKPDETKTTKVPPQNGTPSTYPYPDAFVEIASQEITEVQSVTYSHSQPNTISINYWNEEVDAENRKCWNMTMESSANVLRFVETLNELWKPSFGVDLPLTEGK
eukprot:m.222201 g.222201  ORF g.222201 m.222201 type:complete len:1248 (+) comp33366_c1_seq1:150-3893(+)